MAGALFSHTVDKHRKLLAIRIEVTVQLSKMSCFYKVGWECVVYLLMMQVFYFLIF